MATQGLSSRQTLIVAIGAVVAAIILGSLLFLSDIDSFLRDIGK